MKNEKDLLVQAKEYASEFDAKFEVNQTPQVRLSLLDEETLEFLEAMEKSDVIETFDALADQLYIIGGILNAVDKTIIELGIADVHLYFQHNTKAYISNACLKFGTTYNTAIFAVSDCLKEVHRSNLTKLENGKPLKREDGKILKGSGYQKPNLEPILYSYNIK